MTQNKVIVEPPDRWADAAAAWMGRTLKEFQDNRKHGITPVALAGGNTPAPVYRALMADHSKDLQWKPIHLFLSDERMVRETHRESNMRMVKENLAPLPAAMPPAFHPVATHKTPDEAARIYETDVLITLPTGLTGMPRFDLVVLGLGADGHTASLFPGAPTLEPGTRLALSAQHPSNGGWRVTLTVPVIANARRVLFLVAGENKSRIVQQVHTSGPTPKLPATLVASQAEDVTWILDEPAASRL